MHYWFDGRPIAVTGDGRTLPHTTRCPLYHLLLPVHLPHRLPYMTWQALFFPFVIGWCVVGTRGTFDVGIFSWRRKVIAPSLP